MDTIILWIGREALGGLCADWIWEASQPRDVFVMSAFACGLAGMAIQKLRGRQYPTR